MKLKLSNRLMTIVSYIDTDSKVADVGTDHGYIPVYLAENGMTHSIIASDLREMPLENAKQTALNRHVDQMISFRLCDGLGAVSSDECDTIIMAGMGGNTIRDIMTEAKWCQTKHIIIQPQTQIAELRNWLHENGITVRNASLAQDFGRFYVIWDCYPGWETNLLDPFDMICDPKIVEKKDTLLLPFAEGIHNKYYHILNCIKKSDSTNVQKLNDVLSIIDRANKIIELKNSDN